MLCKAMVGEDGCMNKLIGWPREKNTRGREITYRTKIRDEECLNQSSGKGEEGTDKRDIQDTGLIGTGG